MYSEEECLISLRNAANVLGKSPTARDYNELGITPSYGSIYEVFGSWEEAKQNAGLESTNHKNAKSVDTSYFEDIDTPETAYWIGYLWGDGNVQDHGNRLQLRLTSTDDGVVQNFRDAVSSNHKVQYKEKDGTHSENWTIAIGVREFIDCLISHGLTPGKTFSTSLPTVTSDLRPHFVRGLFDADGCWGNPNWIITGASYGRFERLSEWLPVDSNIYTDSREGKRSHDLKVGKRNWPALISWLYPDGIDTEPLLERKSPF